MRTTHVVILPYDPKWNEDFSAIRAELEAAMGNVKSYAQNWFWYLVEIYYRGRVNRPLVTLQQAGRKVSRAAVRRSSCPWRFVIWLLSAHQVLLLHTLEKNWCRRDLKWKAASVPCDGFHIIRWRCFWRYRGMTSKFYTEYPKIPELPDLLLDQTSNPETQLYATSVATI